MKRSVSIAIAAILCAVPGGIGAQNRASAGMKESFNEFRNRLRNDYNDFRGHILKQYADFLEGEWHPYEPLRVPERDAVPKPTRQPQITTLPSAKPGDPKPADGDIKVSQKYVPSGETGNHGPERILPTSPAVDNPRIVTEDFEFYGIPLSLERMEFNILNNVSCPADAAAQWKALQRAEGEKTAGAIDALAGELGFNGYLTFRLAEAYLKQRFPAASASSIMSATHFMLANMGYDARLALTSSGVPLMLLPMEQTVYGSLYLNLNGRSYTAFTPEGVDAEALNGVSISTCTLPEIKDKGRVCDLKINGLNIPVKHRTFELKGGPLTLRGQLNENLYKMLYRYPQMPTEDFALSTLDGPLRDQLVAQVRDQLGSMNDQEAVNSLLEFFHALPYATDEQRHGFEKPYFLEETLYYDKCDCEDRAIMFTWLLWNALGVPSHLIAYPGHESASVHLKEDPEHRAGYTWENASYWIADPTYIGASVGDVMPVYSTTVPHIDLSYK